MATKVLACLLVLTVTAAHGASILPLDLMDNLQELLLNPESMGVRMKRSASDNWDKEFDLEVLGLGFKLKYLDPTNPYKGGHAHVMFPGQRFINELPFDDVELDIEFKGGDAIDGLFELKVDYKFVEKRWFLADRPQAGKLNIYRKLEGGLWKTRVAVENNNRTPKPFFDINVESDRKTKFIANFQYDEDNHWEIKLDRIPGKSITGVVIINGEEHHLIGTVDPSAKKLNVKMTGHGKTYNVDFKLRTRGAWAITAHGDVEGPIDIKMSMNTGFKKGEIVVKYKNYNYASINFVGDATIQNMIPKKVDYTMKYTILDGVFDGKAKVNFDALTNKKSMKLSFVPKTGQDLTLDYSIEFTRNHGWKTEYEATRGGVSYYKTKHVADVIANDGNKFEMHFTSELNLIPQSYMYNFWCTYVGKCFAAATRDIKVVYHKKDKNFILGKMKIEDSSTVDGKKFHERKLDTTKTPYTLTWYKPEGWFTTQSLFGVDQVEVKAWHTIGKELKVETNIENIKLTIRRDPDYFVELVKHGETMIQFHTEITPALFTTNIDTLFHLPSNTLFHKVFCSYGKGCFNKREGHMKIVVDRQNKNALLNKFSVESTIKKDDVEVFEFKTSTMVTPYTLHINAPYILPNVFNDPTRKTIDATMTHVLGNKLEIKTNCPEVKTFDVTTAGGKKHVVLNGKELVVVDYTTGDKKISQTTELPTGEHVTTTVEWTTESIKHNKVKVTVEVTPDRKFEGTFDWNVKSFESVDLQVDIKGKNPYVGDYEITRKGDYKGSSGTTVLNMVGKTAFSSGPLAPFSPIDTLVKINFDKSSQILNANLVKTVGGKKYGVTVSQNRFSLLSGRA